MWPLAIRQGEDGAKQLEKTVLKLRQDQKGEIRKDWHIPSWPPKKHCFYYVAEHSENVLCLVGIQYSDGAT